MTLIEDNVFVSDQPLNELPQDVKSLGHHLMQRLDLHRDRVILVDVESQRKWTGAQLRDKILAMASCLVANYGFKQGTAVCIDFDHSDLSVIVAFAVICAGGMVAGALPKDPYAELLYVTRKVEVKYLFCHRKNLHLAQKLEQDMRYPVVGIAMDDDLYSDDSRKDSKDSICHLFHHDCTQTTQQELPVACQDLNEDIAFFCMSSGTTGKPKAIPASHYTCLMEVSTLKNVGEANVGSSSSLDYISGRILIVGAIEYGYKAIIMNGFDPENYARAIEKYKIHSVTVGAASFYNLITYKQLNKYDISSVVVIFPMGAKIVYLDKLKEFLEQHPHIQVVRQGFGASELSGAAIKDMTPEEYLRNSECCGRLKPGMMAKIVDTSTGKRLGKNQQGSLRIKGTTVFSGYIDLSLVRSNQQSTPYIRNQSVFDEDGYYITGDLAYFNEHEELYIVGREKELMSCRGAKKVVPQELEELIAEHPAVCVVSVLGIPNAKELTLHCPRAFIKVREECYVSQKELRLVAEIGSRNGFRENNESDEEKLEHEGQHNMCSLPVDRRRKLAEDIMEFVNQRISWEKHLTGGIVLLDDLPIMYPSGKINKSQLRRLSKNQVEIYGDRSSRMTYNNCN